MAKCNQCQKKGFFLKVNKDGKCDDCVRINNLKDEEKKINLRKFTESGGMPSSHTSSVVALVTSLGIKCGTDSPIFATALVFAIIVMYDAAGVRRAAGKQAGVLNRLIHSLGKKDNSIKIEVELKELIGHTPFEVLVGAVLGFFVAFLLMK